MTFGSGDVRETQGTVLEGTVPCGFILLTPSDGDHGEHQCGQMTSVLLGLLALQPPSSTGSVVPGSVVPGSVVPGSVVSDPVPGSVGLVGRPWLCGVSVPRQEGRVHHLEGLLLLRDLAQRDDRRLTFGRVDHDLPGGRLLGEGVAELASVARPDVLKGPSVVQLSPSWVKVALSMVHWSSSLHSATFGRCASWPCRGLGEAEDGVTVISSGETVE